MVSLGLTNGNNKASEMISVTPALLRYLEIS